MENNKAPIKLKIQGREVELSVEEARNLYNELVNIFSLGKGEWTSFSASSPYFCRTVPTQIVPPRKVEIIC